MFYAIILAASLLAGSDRMTGSNGVIDLTKFDDYEIEVQVVTKENQEDRVSSGTIVVKDGQAAMVNVVLFANGSYRISSSQSWAGVSESSDRSGTVIFESELAALVDLSLSPSRADDGGIRIEGTMETMRRAMASGKPRYEIVTDAIDSVLEGAVIDKGSVRAANSLDLLVKMPNGDTRLRVTAHRKHEVPERPTKGSGKVRPVTFETEYSLYNEDARKFEEPGQKCAVFYRGQGSERDKCCMWYDYFPRPEGDSLLYFIEYWVRDLRWIDDDSFSVRVEVMRVTSTNTAPFDPTEKQISFNDAVVSQHSKLVTTRAGEVLDVVLEKESNSPLPFTAVEKIRLKSTVGR
jgi:hypothetical protein